METFYLNSGFLLAFERRMRFSQLIFWYTYKTSGPERSGLERSGDERFKIRKGLGTKGPDAKGPEENVRGRE